MQQRHKVQMWKRTFNYSINKILKLIYKTNAWNLYNLIMHDNIDVTTTTYMVHLRLQQTVYPYWDLIV